MIVSAISRDQEILDNILGTLSQLRQGGTPLGPLVLQHQVPSNPEVTVSFYVDAAKNILLFSDDSTAHPERFTRPANRTIYTPVDELVNFSPQPISDRYCQPTYYVTATFSDATVLEVVYNNLQNLVFQSVTVASADKPEFGINANALQVVPLGSKEKGTKASDDYRWLFPEYRLYIQLLVFNWEGLSETIRLDRANTVNNLIRNALYADRYRNHNAGLFDESQDGTYVSEIKLLPSKDTFRASLTVKCSFPATSTTY